MYLKRLEIQGFKSFAKKTLLEFDKGITAIVGPNGSGKSNTADCLRWVLGEQSAKLMRGKKSDDVIFAGSDQKGRAGLAEVFATFDNRDRKIPVDSAEVSIGRRVDRSGESEYLINGNKVRLLDIVDLVLKSNIGTSRYTVIGQGTIDQFILQGPSGVKELIDEASGVKTYYMRREKTLRRLEQTAQNLMRAEDLIAEIEPRLKSLRRLAKRMEEREKIEVEMKLLLMAHFGNSHIRLSSELEIAQKKLSDAEMARARAEEEINRMLQASSSSDKRKDDQVVALGGLQSNFTKLQHEKNKLLEHLSMLRGRLESRKSVSAGDPETLRANLHIVTGKLEELKASLQKIEQEEKTQKVNLAEATSRLAEINKRLEEVYRRLSEPHEIDANRLVNDLESLEVSFYEFFNVIETSGDLSSVQRNATSFRQKFLNFKQVLHGELTSPQNTMKQLKELLQGTLAEKERVSGSLSAMSVEISKTSVAREFLSKQVEGLEVERHSLEIEISKASSTDSDFVTQIAEEESRLKRDLSGIEKEIANIQSDMQVFYDAEKKEREEANEHDKIVREKQQVLMRLRDTESSFAVEKARIDTNFENLQREVMQALGEEGWVEVVKQKQLTEDNQLVHKIERLRHQLEMIGGVDELTVKEYTETEMRHTHLTGQVDDLKKAMQDLKSVMDELDTHITSSFNQAFHKINEKFEYYFRILFNGGRAYLSVIKNEEKPEPEEAAMENEDADESQKLRPEEKIVKKYEHGKNNIYGIDIKATPPGKKLSTIQALSGGERALTSIALLCSLLSSFPSPFVMLDEVDAALDEANTMRFGQILGTLAHQTQFITITHNRETMSQANTIYGVTMGDDGISKLLSIKFDQAKVFAK